MSVEVRSRTGRDTGLQVEHSVQSGAIPTYLLPRNRIAKRVFGKGLLQIELRRPGMATLTAKQDAMVALFQRHVDAELAGDLEITMATMTDNPHLNHVSSMAGGVGRDGVHA